MSLIVFGIWMLFFDQNNFFFQSSISRELHQLEARKRVYIHQNDLLRAQKESLFGNIENLEKLAREKYLMKRDDEEVFLIHPEN